MTVALVLIVSAVVVGMAVALWRLTGPGKRLRLGAVNLFHTSTVTPDEARRAAQYLVAQKFEIDARLTREGSTYRLQLICPPGQSEEKQAIACEVLAAGLSDDVFAGAAAEVHICDNIFRPTSVVRHRGRFGRRLAMNAAHLFYLEGVTDSQALEVAAFLAGMGVFDDSPKIAQMNCSPEGYEFRLAVEVDPLAPEMVQGARQMAIDLSKVLKAQVAVRFCRGLLDTLHAIRLGDTDNGAANTHIPGGPYRTKVFRIPSEPNAE
jgi:hypothetical protein